MADPVRKVSPASTRAGSTSTSSGESPRGRVVTVEMTERGARVDRVGRCAIQPINPAKVSSRMLKTKAMAVITVQMLMQTMKTAFMRTGTLVLGVLLVPVNAYSAATNLIDVIANRANMPKEKLMAQIGIMIANCALLTTGIMMLKTFFTTHNLLGVVKSGALKAAKLAGVIGLFTLVAVHLGKAIMAFKRYQSSGDPAQLRKMIYNLISAVGLTVVGLIVSGVVGAAITSPYGWAALSLVGVGLSLESYFERGGPPPQQTAPTTV